LIGWFLLLAQPCSFRLNRLVIDAGTCVIWFYRWEWKFWGAIAPGCNCVTSHYMILLLSCHCYLWRVLKV
jgi:hypothetical protein